MSIQVETKDCTALGDAEATPEQVAAVVAIAVAFRVQILYAERLLIAQNIVHVARFDIQCDGDLFGFGETSGRDRGEHAGGDRQQHLPEQRPGDRANAGRRDVVRDR